MISIIKNTLTLFFVGIALPAFTQSQWIGKLSLSDFDCENQTACYNLAIKGVGDEAWALGDQNYRFFFDADNISISTINSLLPTDIYSQPQTDEILEIVGQNQEAFSPLDNIDDNLGFVDFNIIAQAKQFPHLARQVSNEAFLPIAEICLEVSEEMMSNTGEEYAMNILFSRPLTAGQITNQYSVISEINEPNHTKSTQSVGYLDVTYDVGLHAQLGEICQLLNSTEEEILLAERKLSLYPNPYVIGEVLSYNSVIMKDKEHEVFIYDGQSQLIKHWEDLPAGNDSIRILEALPAGVYFFHIKSEKHQVMKEFIIVQ